MGACAVSQLCVNKYKYVFQRVSVAYHPSIRVDKECKEYSDNNDRFTMSIAVARSIQS